MNITEKLLVAVAFTRKAQNRNFKLFTMGGYYKPFHKDNYKAIEDNEQTDLLVLKYILGGGEN